MTDVCSLDMVKLWCMRNGLGHVEASAATGEGIEQAFEDLIRLALSPKEKEEEEPAAQKEATQSQVEQQQQQQQQPIPLEPAPAAPVVWRYNKELDLQQRYASKEERCCLPVLLPVRRLLRSCLSR